jgi:HD domain/GAF domain
MPLQQTYCQRVLAGRLPNLIPDVRADDRAASLPITEAADVGAFVSVALTFSDGRLYGTLGAASHQAKPSLGYTDLQFLHVFARVVADQLELELERRTQAVQETTRAMELQSAAGHGADRGARAARCLHRQSLAGGGQPRAAVARQLRLSETEVTDVKQVALLHDIGKIAVPDTILAKSGPLTEEEWAVMRRHPIYGEAMISKVRELAHPGADGPRRART